MERFTGEKYLPCIKKWLIHAGYNKLVALAELNDEKIAKLEDHIGKNPALVANSKCCYSDTYKSQTKFGFLPGHKAIILGIARQISRMKEHSSSNSVAKKSKSKVKIRSETQIKSMLIESLSAFSTKFGLKLPAGVISGRNITNFEEMLGDTNEENGGEKAYQCTFSCPFCINIIPVSYKAYWQSSNVTRHIQHHIKESAEEVRYEDVIVEEEIDSVNDEESSNNLS